MAREIEKIKDIKNNSYNENYYNLSLKEFINFLGSNRGSLSYIKGVGNGNIKLRSVE